MNPIVVRPLQQNRAAALLLRGCIAFLATAVAVSSRAADYYVMPEAKGAGDGASWASAAAAPAAGWTSQIARLAPGDTLHIGSGVYAGATFGATKGGEKGAPVTILGEDTGGGLPVFRGSWHKEKPATGEIFCNLAIGTGFVTLKNLRVEHYQVAVVTSGGNEGVVLSGLDVKDVRMGVVFKNGARADVPGSWTRDVLVENCAFTGFTKSALRWEGGNHDFRIVNCRADAGGKPYDTDPFHMIYDIRGDQRKGLPAIIGRVHDHDITFVDCTARNAWHEATHGRHYWNGDGFVAERGVSRLTFIGCRAFDCTDGGFDLKASEMTFKGCVSFRNKRNFRLWDAATLDNCAIGFPVKRGGSGDAANVGVYARGVITLDHCTLIGDASQFSIDVKDSPPDTLHVRAKNSLVISINKEPPHYGKEVELDNTPLFRLSEAPSGPVFKGTPPEGWDGSGTAFDALPAYDGEGYRQAAAR